MSTIERKPILHGRDHCPGGADPIPCMIGAPSDEIITHPCLVALWKLDEAAGDIAYDSGPGSLDLGSAAYAPPTWGQPAGPPGTLTAGFADGLGLSDAVTVGDAAVAPLDGDFAAELWFNRSTTGHGAMLGQGSPTNIHARGWSLDVNSAVEYSGSRATLYIGSTSVGPNVVESDIEADVDTWYHLAFSRASGVFSLYLNGAVQSTTSSADYDPVTSDGETWIGNDLIDAGQTRNFNGELSWAAVFDCALSAEEIAAHYEFGLVDSAEGKAPLADGLGGVTWDFPLEVTF